jgi:hypothetical protein
VRIAKLELHQLPFNLRCPVFEIGGRKRVMRVNADGQQRKNKAE